MLRRFAKSSTAAECEPGRRAHGLRPRPVGLAATANFVPKSTTFIASVTTVKPWPHSATWAVTTPSSNCTRSAVDERHEARRPQHEFRAARHADPGPAFVQINAVAFHELVAHQRAIIPSHSAPLASASTRHRLRLPLGRNHVPDTSSPTSANAARPQRRAADIPRTSAWPATAGAIARRRRLRLGSIDAVRQLGDRPVAAASASPAGVKKRSVSNWQCRGNAAKRVVAAAEPFVELAEFRVGQLFRRRGVDQLPQSLRMSS